MPEPDRCQRCPACLEVKRVARLATPNPPFSHASDHLIRVWNQTLADNPCETWTAGQRELFYRQLLRCSAAIRPTVPLAAGN